MRKTQVSPLMLGTQFGCHLAKDPNGVGQSRLSEPSLPSPQVEQAQDAAKAPGDLPPAIFLRAGERLREKPDMLAVGGFEAAVDVSEDDRPRKNDRPVLAAGFRRENSVNLFNTQAGFLGSTEALKFDLDP